MIIIGSERWSVKAFRQNVERKGGHKQCYLSCKMTTGFGLAYEIFHRLTDFAVIKMR